MDFEVLYEYSFNGFGILLLVKFWIYWTEFVQVLKKRLFWTRIKAWKEVLEKNSCYAQKTKFSQNI